MLSNSLENHQNSLKEFDRNYKIIIDNIENKTNDIIDLNHNIFLLERCLISAKESFETIKKIDPLNDITFDPDHFQQMIDSAKKIVEDYKITKIEIDFKKTINDFKQKLQEISSKIQKSKEDNKCIYSSNITAIVKTNLKIDFPDISIIKPINNEEFNKEYEEMINLFEKTKIELKDLYSVLDRREKESIEIEEKSKLAVKNSKFSPIWLDSSYKELMNARKCIADAESIKNWDENAHGSTIDIYNQNIKDAYKNDQENVQKIENLMIKKMDEIKKIINENKQKNLKKSGFLLDDLIKCNIQLNKVIDERTTIKELLDVNEKMKFDKKDSIDEISVEIDKAEEDIKKLIIDFVNGISHYIDNESSLNCSILKEQIQNDNNHASELSPYEIDQKGIELMSDYIKLFRCKCLIIKLNTKYDLHLEIPENMNELLIMLQDSVIICRSTFLLNPVPFSSNIIERTQNCKDPKFSYLMAVLYVNKFLDEKENKYDIINVNEAKQIIESFPNRDSKHVNKSE